MWEDLNEDTYVKVDSSTSSDALEMILASAGILSPLENLMISPGTRLLARVSKVWPSRKTLQCGGASLFKASSDCADLYS